MHPILFTVPGIDLPIYSYGVMLGLSLVVGWYVVTYLGKKDGIEPSVLANCYLWTAVCAVVGSRVLYIITNLSDFENASLIDMINVRKGGLVAYGGFLGGFVGSWIYLRRQSLRLLPWADAVVPALGTGLGITRIGCFLYGCDYGRPIPESAPSWIKAIGIRFPNWDTAFPELAHKFKEGIGLMSGAFQGAPAFRHHLSMNLVEMGSTHSALVYPTQLMEVVNGWLAFGLTMLVRRRLRFRGQAFLFFTAYYGLTRTLMEFLRGDTQRGGIGEVSTSQIIGIATLVVAISVWVILARRARNDPQAAMSLSLRRRDSDRRTKGAKRPTGQVKHKKPR